MFEEERGRVQSTALFGDVADNIGTGTDVSSERVYSAGTHNLFLMNLLGI